MQDWNARNLNDIDQTHVYESHIERSVDHDLVLNPMIKQTIITYWNQFRHSPQQEKERSIIHANTNPRNLY
jgi:hypothetical protein